MKNASKSIIYKLRRIQNGKHASRASRKKGASKKEKTRASRVQARVRECLNPIFLLKKFQKMAQDQQARKQGAKPCTRTLRSHGDSAFCLKPCVLRLCLLLHTCPPHPPHPPQRMTLISCVAAGCAAAALAAAEMLPFPPPNLRL